MTSPAVPPPTETIALPRPRIALVGCGTVGGLHRDRLLTEPAQIVAICDPNADALARMAASLPQRPRLFRSELDLLAAGNVDAVVLCTPHGKHAEQIRHAIDAGVHVLCEKPFVTDPQEAAQLVEAARMRNVALFVAYTRRSRGHARFLQASTPRIGPLTHVVITRAQPWVQRHSRTWRVRSEEGGGFLLDAGASLLDLLMHLEPTSLSEIDAELRRLGPTDVDVRASIRLTFTNGMRADITLIGDATEEVERIQLFGEKGTAGWLLREDTPAELYIRPEGGPSETGDPAAYRTLSPDAAFVAALRAPHAFGANDAPNLYDASTAVPVVAAVEQIYQQASWR